MRRLSNFKYYKSGQDGFDDASDYLPEAGQDVSDFEDKSKDAITENEVAVDTNERYDEIFDSTRLKTAGFSVASVVLGILSVVCCFFFWCGIIFGVLAIVLSVISRRVLGYFDKMSIAGLIVGIFGVCFGALMIFFSYGPLAEALSEIIARMGAGAALNGSLPTHSL